MAKNTQSKQAEPTESLFELIDQFGAVTAKLMTHERSPNSLRRILSEMMSEIDSQIDSSEQQAERERIEAGTILPLNLRYLCAQGS
ncbi:MAG: hypothetical protein JNK38_14510 [Acidobacteria bacterium]|nr:hypothetical protein [Acidobacteriota bacterium]